MAVILEAESEAQDKGECGWAASVLVSLCHSCPGGGSRLSACWTPATAGTQGPRYLQSMSSVLQVGHTDGLSADDCTESL